MPPILPGSQLLGDTIAAEFAKGTAVVMLENHGVVIGFSDIFKAFMAFETLKSSALLQLNALKLGKLKLLTPAQIEDSRQKNVADLPKFTPMSHFKPRRTRSGAIVKFIHHSYEQSLFTSTQGTYSAPLEDGSSSSRHMAWTACYLEVEDLVLVRDGCRQWGRTQAARRCSMQKFPPSVRRSAPFWWRTAHVMAFPSATDTSL